MLFLLALVPAGLQATSVSEALRLVQPWTYRSPSGTVELFIEPSQSHGAGPAGYRLTRDGKEAWTRTHPFTLVDVLLLDDGSAGGYAYSEGVLGLGELVAAALNPDGSVRWEERTARFSPYPCSRDPIVYELQPFVGGFGLNLSARPRSDRWSTFDWSTGRSLKPRQMLPAESSAVPPQIVDVPVPPSIEFPCLGRVLFPWPTQPPEPGVFDERRERQPHRVYVDSLDRVWISEFSSHVVHVFDSAGTALLELTPDPKTFRPYRTLEWMSLRGDGHLFVCADRGIEEFNPAGRHVQWSPIEEIPPPRWMFLPDKNDRWVIHPIGSIEFFGPDGLLPRTIRRAANGRWFQDLVDSAIAPDGSLAVLDEPNPGISSRDPSTWVQLIAPTGEPRRSLRVPAEFCGYPLHVAYDGHRIALLHGRLLLLLNENGSPIGRTTFSEELGEPYYLFFSPDGAELWVFPHMRHEMFRFALPP